LGRSAVSRAKTAESIEMPFGVWTQVGPRKLDGVQIEGAILIGEMMANDKVYGLTAVSCAELLYRSSDAVWGAE